MPIKLTLLNAAKALTFLLLLKCQCFCLQAQTSRPNPNFSKLLEEYDDAQDAFIESDGAPQPWLDPRLVLYKKVLPQLKRFPKSPELRFLQIALQLELSIMRPNAAALQEVRKIIIERPDIYQAYDILFLFSNSVRPISDSEALALRYQQLKYRKKDFYWSYYYIFRIYGSDPQKYAEEIFPAYRRYRSAVPFEAVPGDSWDTEHLVIHALASLSRFNEVRSIVREIIEYGVSTEDPGGVCAANHGLFNEALKPDVVLFNEWTTFYQYCSNNELYGKAIEMEQKGAISESIKALEEQIVVNPYYFATYNMLIELYLKWVMPTQAIKVIKTFVTADATRPHRCYLIRRLGSSLDLFNLKDEPEILKAIEDCPRR